MVKQAPQEHDVDIVIEGQRHRGRYTLEHGVITVSYTGSHVPFSASKSTQVGGSDPSWLARVLLRELIAEIPRVGH